VAEQQQNQDTPPEQGSTSKPHEPAPQSEKPAEEKTLEEAQRKAAQERAEQGGYQ
jgi:hypothetical protein